MCKTLRIQKIERIFEIVSSCYIIYYTQCNMVNFLFLRFDLVSFKAFRIIGQVQSHEEGVLIQKILKLGINLFYRRSRFTINCIELLFTLKKQLDPHNLKVTGGAILISLQRLFESPSYMHRYIQFDFLLIRRDYQLSTISYNLMKFNLLMLN